MMDRKGHAIEQPEGPPLVPSVDLHAIDMRRKAAYLSFEKFLRRGLVDLDQRRGGEWHRDYTSVAAYRRSTAPMRRRLKAMLGFWIEPKQRPPLPTLRQRRRERIVHQAEFDAFRYELPIAAGVSTYAVELVPSAAATRRPGLLMQHGYNGTPELACGFTPGANGRDVSYRSLGIRAVRRGYHVVSVFHPGGYGVDSETVNRPLDRFPHHPAGYGRNRLDRMARMQRGTLFGLDMLASSRGVDLLCATAGVDRRRIGMYGLSQGGMSALFLPAMDQRIAAAVCSAYFNARLGKLIGPGKVTCYLDWYDESPFFRDVVSCFSDADLVSLIAPRAFAVEAGRLDSSVDRGQAVREFAKARRHYQKLGVADRAAFIGHDEGHVSATRRAFEFLDEHLGTAANGKQ